MGIPMNPRSFQDLQWMGVDGVLLSLVPVDDPSLHLFTCWLSRWIFHVELPRTRTYTAQRVLGKGSFGVVYQAW